VDRVLVDSVLDRADLGIYGLAVTLSSLVRYSADSVGFVLYPIYLRLYGETRDAGRLRDHLEKPTAFLALLVSTVLGLSYLVLHLPVRWFLPEFEPSIEIFRMLTIAVVFSCLSILPGFFLMAINRQNWLVPLGLGAVAFNYFAGLAAVRNGHGLPGVAAVTAIGLGLHTTCVLALSGRHARGSSLGAARFVAETYLPVAYVAGLVVALRLLVPRSAASAWGETARASLEGAIFLLLSLPLLAYFEKRTGFIAGFRRGRSAR
jgi:O-antigen/teichoic acid export membrane protein